MSRLTITLICTALIVGCVGPGRYAWYKEGVTEEVASQALAQCRLESLQWSGATVAVPGSEVTVQRSVTREDREEYASNCMRLNGYRLEWMASDSWREAMEGQGQAADGTKPAP